MATAIVTPGRRSRRIAVRVPVTYGTDISFGITVHVPRRPRPRARALRDWTRALSRSGLLVVNVVVPIAILVSTADLVRVGDAFLGTRSEAAAPLTYAAPSARPLVQSRHTVITATSPDAPQVQAHVVAPGETLVSIAAEHGVAPQTVAYDNGISDSAALRVGQSILIPPFDAAIHVMAAGETIATIATRYGADPDTVRLVNRLASDDGDATPGRPILVPVLDARYPSFQLRLSDPPRVVTPRLRWPTAGVITQRFSVVHTGIDIAAPYGSPIVASDSGTVTFNGWRGPGGLAVCVYLDWGPETCAYHTSAVFVNVGDRVFAGQRIAAIGLTGETTGPHVHWEVRTNGALVDPLTYTATRSAP